MISQYCMTLSEALPANAAYPLYAALLEKAPAWFSAYVHEGSMTPVSQYVLGQRWYVSLLTDRCEETMGQVLEDLDTLLLHKLGKQVKITARQTRRISSVEELLNSRLPETVTLHLATPTAFKSGGAYQLLPTQRLLVQSLLLKWNACLSDVCPIEDEGEGLEALASGLIYRDIRLESRMYAMKNTAIPGTVGTVCLEKHLSGFHRQLMDALLSFGAYSGVGIKNALGMGGLRIE